MGWTWLTGYARSGWVGTGRVASLALVCCAERRACGADGWARAQRVPRAKRARTRAGPLATLALGPGEATETQGRAKRARRV